MNKKHILVISQYFYPEEFRINDICREWVKRGYKVTVLTGIPNYPSGNFFKGYGYFKKNKEVYEGIRILRIPIFPRLQKSMSLILNYISFVISGFFWVLFTKTKADYVFVFETSPVIQAYPGIWYAKKNKCPCYLYITDLWPESVEIVAGIKNKFILGLIGKIVEDIYKNCTRVFVSSQSFIKAVCRRGVSKSNVEFWPQYAEDYYKPVKKVKLAEIFEGKICKFLFAGNIGYAQGLWILCEAAIKLKERSIDAHFIIVGNGRYKRVLKSMVKNNEVDHMFTFIDRQPPQKIPFFMSASDASLICLQDSEVFSITLPSKVQSCLACGKPVIASASGEIQNVIEVSGSGFCSHPGDIKGLVENIIKFISLSSEKKEKMGQKARAYSAKNFDKEILLSKMDKWFY